MNLVLTGLVFSRIAQDGSKGPRPRRISEPSGDEEDLQLLSPEERDRRKSFEQKRKMHYNEYYAVKMARQLMQVHTGSKWGGARPGGSEGYQWGTKSLTLSTVNFFGARVLH